MNKDLKHQTMKVKNAKKMASTQKYLRVSEVRDDVMVLKNGGVRSIIEVSAVNFNLKSEDEQNAIIYSYQNFLNTLEFPLQIVIQSRKLDLDVYLQKIKEKIKLHENELLKQQTEEYINFVKKLLEYADIMEKKFYVVVPFDPYRSQDPNFFQKFVASLKGRESATDISQKHKEFENNLKNLNQRTNVVTSGLESIGLKVNQLNTKQIIELMYKTYNPVVSRNQKATDIGQSALLNDEESNAFPDSESEEKTAEKNADEQPRPEDIAEAQQIIEDAEKQNAEESESKIEENEVPEKVTDEKEPVAEVPPTEKPEELKKEEPATEEAPQTETK